MRLTELEKKLKRELCEVERLIDKSGLSLFLGEYAPGNISARSPRSGQIFISPSGLPKGKLHPKDLVTIGLDGKVIEGKLKPSSELKMHCSIYAKRPDVNAVLHIHSPATMAYAVSRKPLPVTTVELAALTGHEVSVAQYFRPGTAELAEVTAQALGNARAVIMGNHGLVTVGVNPKEAFHIACAVEYTATVNIYGQTLGTLNSLPDEEVGKIFNGIRQTYGQG